MAPDLIQQGNALAECLAGLNSDLSIASLGQPECLPVLLVRPTLGEDNVAGQRCVFTVTWVISAYWDLACGLEEAQAAIYTLMSGCSVAGSILGHLQNRDNLAPLRAIGAGILKIDAPRGFSVAQYATDSAPNTFWAQVPITLTYSC